MPHGRAIPFTKVHGLGNDFILIDATADAGLADLDFAAAAPAWCNRNKGIGADGVLVLSRPTDPSRADARMRIINSDGTEAEMCGNGVRCVARHLAEHHHAAQNPLRVEVGRPGSLRMLDIRVRRDPRGTFTAAEVNMGPPRLDSAEIPVLAPAGRVIDFPLATSPGRPPLRATCVSMGNPHAVIFVERVADIALDELGPAIEHHALFPERTNVQFVQVDSPDHATIRTWERGAGPTLACGTGACAVLVAAVLTHRLARKATITLPGGDLLVRWDEPTNSVFMTGPAAVSFTGMIAT